MICYKDTKENKEQSTQLKHHCQLKITCTYLLPYLAEQKIIIRKQL